MPDSRLPAPLDQLPEPQITTWDGLIAAITAIPSIGGITATWLGQRRAVEYQRRIHGFLQDLARRIGRLENARPRLDEALAELIADALPLVARSSSAEKRSRYAALLAKAAIRENDEEIDTARTMGLLLDQLEYRHVRILDDLVAKAQLALKSTSQPAEWAGVRGIELRVNQAALVAEVTRSHIHSELLRMHGLGLLNVGPDTVVITTLGSDFHTWLRDLPARECST